MKQMLVELDDTTAAELENVAPGRMRLRSKFVRMAIRAALDAVLERRTAKAYRRSRDSADDWFFDSSMWDEWAAPRTGRRR